MYTIAQSKQRLERGQALAEFSLILPILLLVVFGIIDFGRIIFVFSDASGALRDAAREANVLGLSNASIPNYANCDVIRATALATRFVSNEEVDVYYWDTTDPDTNVLVPFNAAQAATINQPPDPTAQTSAFLSDAHYSCEGGLTISDPPPGITDIGTGSVLDNGDIMRVHYTGRIHFITPFLGTIWPGIDLNFYAQRTVVTQLTLGSTDGIDYDFDGLDDRWEFMWWGCIDGNDVVHQVDAAHKFKPVETWESWTIGGQPWAVVCDTRPVSNPEDPALADVLIPKEINTDEVNAIRDTDLDECNMGCEELRNSQPIAYGGEDGTDSDGDGLTDGEEVNLYFSSPTGGDWTYCDMNQRYGEDDGSDYPAMSDGVPDGYDSDCDGVPDGVEVGSDRDPDYGSRIQPNHSTYVYPGKEAPFTNPPISGWPYRASYAFLPDTDGNLMFDSVDSDGDGLYDHQEYYDATPCADDGEIGDRPIEATPYECHPDITRTVSFPVNQYFTNPTWYDEVTPPGADGVDTDNDGLSDMEETGGFPVGPFMLNRVPFSGTYYTHPNYADGDQDGLSDGDEINTLVYGGYTDPSDSDTDGDGLSDYMELLPIADGGYGSNPLDDDGDFDNLSDYEEINTYFSSPNNANSEPGASGGADTDADGYPDALTPAMNELLPGETLTDADACRNMNDGYEVNTLGTDPTKIDTDGDGFSDCYELDSNLNPLTRDTDGDGIDEGPGVTADCAPHDNPNPPLCGTGGDTDSDQLPDWWEMANFGNLAQTDIGHADTDLCNNLCEYQRGTDPLDPDSDGDLLLDHEELPDSSPTNPDTDGDGLNDYAEKNYVYNGVPSPLNARNSDSDGDGIPDNTEVNTQIPTYGGYSNAASRDTDGDFLFDNLELYPTANAALFPAGYVWLNTVITNPADEDTDDDGYTDYEEIYFYYTQEPNPTDADTDDDDLSDSVEGGLDDGNGNLVGSFTKINDADTDDDGLEDGIEYLGSSMTINFCADSGGTQPVTLAGYSTNLNGLNPNTSDTDSDGLSDGAEVNNANVELRTNPLQADTDNDGINDDDEVNDGDPDTDPQCGGDIIVVDDDSDNDCIPDTAETAGFTTTNWGLVKTDPNDVDGDSDDDGISDPMELGLTTADYPDCTAGVMTLNITYKDKNGVTQTINQTPFITNPTHLNANGDAFDDGYDSDLDDLSDTQEYNGQTIQADCSNPRDGDYTDTGDLNNVLVKTNPADNDTDGDGMPDADEIANKVNPLDGTCGPALVIAKTNSILDTVLNMYWRNDPSTLNDTPDQAEQEAVTYASGNGFDVSGLIIFARFRTPTNCNQSAWEAKIGSVGANLVDNESAPGGNCDWYVEATIGQIVTLAFESIVAEVGIP